MLPLIPAILGVTLLLAYLLAVTTEPDMSRSRALADNMLLQHKLAVERVLRQDLTSGTLTGLLPVPFVDLGTWNSNIVASGGMTIVATIPGPASTAPVVEITRGLNMVDDVTFVNMPRSGAGLYQSAGGANKVGETSLEGGSLPFVNGTPVIVTLVRENGPG